MTIQIKRIYEEASPDDGFRVLVDRLWPRGMTKERAQLDAWLKDIAPSPQLRTWWNHEPQEFADFKARYRAELDHDPATRAAIAQFWALAPNTGPTTLLYAAANPLVNHARVLADYLTETGTGNNTAISEAPDIH